MFGVIHVSDSYAIVLLLENPNTILLLIEMTCHYQIAAALTVKLIDKTQGFVYGQTRNTPLNRQP